MPNYRYFASDILTGAVLTELPLYGASFGRLLATAGTLSGTFRLGSGRHVDTELLDGTIPGKVALYVERDGTLIWGGIIWTRTYDSLTKAVNISGLTFESYFAHVALEKDFVKQDMDQLTIFRDLVDACQAQEALNLGFQTSQIGLSGFNTTSLVPGYEYHYADTVISDLITVDNGFDYTIDVVHSGAIDHPQRVIRAMGPKMIYGQNLLTFDYPGNVSSYTYAEVGSSGGVKFAQLGAGSGSGRIRAEVKNDSLLRAGFPGWYNVQTSSLIGTEKEASRQAISSRDRLSIPIANPTFNIKPDRATTFEDWNALGLEFFCHIEDARFPGGANLLSRMIGWDLTPGDSSSVEQLSLTIEDKTLEGDNNG